MFSFGIKGACQRGRLGRGEILFGGAGQVKKICRVGDHVLRGGGIIIAQVIDGPGAGLFD